MLSVPQVNYCFHCAFVMRQEEPAEECKVGRSIEQSFGKAMAQNFN